MAKPKKQKKKKKDGLHPKAVKLLVGIVRDPSGAAGAAEEASKFGLDAAAISAAAKSAHDITEDPDASESQGAFDALPFGLQVAVLEVLAEEGAAGFLARAQRDATEKNLAKAVGAAINKLRAQGMDVPDLKERSSVSFDGVAAAPPSCYATPMDGEGNCVVIIAQVGPRGLNVFYALCGDREGLAHFEGVSMPRGGFKRFVKAVEAQVNAPMITISEDYARALVDRARLRSVDAGNPIPTQWHEAKNALAPSEDAPEPWWTHLDADELAEAGDLVAAGEELHDLHEFVAWIPDDDGLDALKNELDAVKGAEKGEPSEEDLAAAVAKAVATTLDEDRREAYGRRLLHNAMVMARTERLDDARKTAATALALLDTKKKIADIPFATKLFDKIAAGLAAGEDVAAELGIEDLPAGAPPAPEVPDDPPAEEAPTS